MYEVFFCVQGVIQKKVLWTRFHGQVHLLVDGKIHVWFVDTIENTTTNTVESLELEDYPKIVPFEAFKWFWGVQFSISLFLESAFKAFEDKEQREFTSSCSKEQSLLSSLGFGWKEPCPSRHQDNSSHQ